MERHEDVYTGKEGKEEGRVREMDDEGGETVAHLGERACEGEDKRRRDAGKGRGVRNENLASLHLRHSFCIKLNIETCRARARLYLRTKRPPDRYY
jgi:hypothetical protein